MSGTPVTPPTPSPHSGINPGSLTTSFSRKPCNPSPLGLNRAIPIPTRLKNPKMSCAKGTKKFSQRLRRCEIVPMHQKLHFYCRFKNNFSKKILQIFSKPFCHTFYFYCIFKKKIFRKIAEKFLKGALFAKILKSKFLSLEKIFSCSSLEL